MCGDARPRQARHRVQVGGGGAPLADHAAPRRGTQRVAPSWKIFLHGSALILFSCISPRFWFEGGGEGDVLAGDPDLGELVIL